MTVALYTHVDMLDHRPGAGHPERPERLRAVTDALSDSDLHLVVRDAPLAEEGDLVRVHPRSYLDTMPMSRNELLEQLTSEYGAGFTYDQALYAVNKVY